MAKLRAPGLFAGSPGASVALRLLKERADSAEARAASATRQIAELKASLQVNQALVMVAYHCSFSGQILPIMACLCPLWPVVAHYAPF